MKTARSAARAERPVVAVLASGPDARALDELFTRRGFVTVPLVASLSGEAPVPAVVIVDLRHARAHKVLDALLAHPRRPVVLGIAPEGASPDAAGHGAVDSLFFRPVDPARLFVQVVELVAMRRTGRRRRKLSGIVGVVKGNELFLLVAHQLLVAVPSVNASAVLEGALSSFGTSPHSLEEADLIAMIHSGRLAAALETFASRPVIMLALKRVLAAIAHPEATPTPVPATKATPARATTAKPAKR